MKNSFMLGAIAVLAIIAALAVSNPEVKGKAKHSIVFHMTTADTAAYSAVARQIKHVYEQWPDAHIEVVAHNKGIDLLVKSKTNVQENITALKSKGVVFSACENTMRTKKIDKSMLVGEAGTVPAGIVRVAELQEMGWSYIKGGF